METQTLEQPTLQFKGVWIPSEIWEAKLTWVEKILWSIISTYGKKGNPCFASNEWFAERLNTTAARVANAISVLRKAKFVVDKGFDGRRRFLLAVVPESEDEVKAALTQALTLPQRQGEPCHNAGVNAEPSPNKKEIKGELKEENGALPFSANTESVNADRKTRQALPTEAQRWNTVCGETLGKIVGWSSTRQSKLNIRRKDPFWALNFDIALNKIMQAPFCCGVNDRGWKASLDWLLERPDALLKIIEGKYASGSRNGNGERRRCY